MSGLREVLSIADDEVAVWEKGWNDAIEQAAVHISQQIGERLSKTGAVEQILLLRKTRK